MTCGRPRAVRMRRGLETHASRQSSSFAQVFVRKPFAPNGCDTLPNRAVRVPHPLIKMAAPAWPDGWPGLKGMAWRAVGMQAPSPR